MTKALFKKLVIFGTGEIASLAHYYFTHDSDYDVVGFTADDQYVNDSQFEGKPLVNFSQVVGAFSPNDVYMHVALSYKKLNQIREQKFVESKQRGYRLASYICSKSIYWPDLIMGENCFILENQTIQPNVHIGDNVMIWSSNHIGHGVRIGSHSYISSHVCLSGHTVVGQRCFFGVNAATKDFVTVADDVFIGMGACVTQDIKSEQVVLTSKGEVLSADDRSAKFIKKKYFG